MSACNKKNEINKKLGLVELELEKTYDFDGIFGIKDIIKVSNDYYILSWGRDELLRVSNERLESSTSISGDGLSVFQSPPQSLIEHNNLIYVLERDSRTINRYNFDLDPIDQIKIDSQLPKRRSLELINDSLFAFSSLLPDKKGLSMYDSNLNYLYSIDLNNQVGFDLWDIKQFSAIDGKIIVGYPFSGRMEVLNFQGDLIKKFDTGTQILDINLPSSNLHENDSPTVPIGLNFLSIQALDSNYLILFTPQREGKYHELYFLDMEGELIGKSHLEGHFQFIHPLNSKIYGFNQITENIEIYKYSLNL